MQREVEEEEIEKISVVADSDNNKNVNDNDNKEDEDDFEFSFVRVLPESDPSLSSADKIFLNGKILPTYPLFNRNLLIDDNDDDDYENNKKKVEIDLKSVRLPLRRLFIEEERLEASFSSTSSDHSSFDDLDGVPSETYCVWRPKDNGDTIKKDRCKKSNSTGSSSSASSSSSSSARWRLKDLVMGRSQSEGNNDKFSFVGSKEGKSNNKLITEQELKVHQEQSTKKEVVGIGNNKKSFLPYKPDIVGFFANVNVNANVLPRSTHHPF